MPRNIALIIVVALSAFILIYSFTACFMLCTDFAGGFGWKGTYAAGKFFHTTIYPNLASYNISWIIVKWQDTNGNSFVNNPSDGDTYTVIATSA